MANKQDALNQANSALATAQDTQGRNLYLNFTDVLNSLDWSPLSNSGADSNTNRNNIATQLQNKVEANFSDFAEKYDAQDYRDIVDGYINRQASYQGSAEGILAKYTNKPMTVDVFKAGIDQTTKDVTSYELDKKKVDAYALNAMYRQSARMDYITQSGKSESAYNHSYSSELAGRNYVAIVNNFGQEFINRQVLHTELLDNSLYTFRPVYMIGSSGGGGATFSATAIAMSNSNIDFSTISEISKKNEIPELRTSMFGVKNTSGTIIDPLGTPNRIYHLAMLTKLKDYTVNSANLISSNDISLFNTYYNNVKQKYNSIDWNDPNAAIDLVEYKKSFNQVIDYLEKTKGVIDTYSEIVKESAKADADINRINTLTERLMSEKAVVLDGATDPNNYLFTIELKETPKAAEYIAAVMPSYNQTINRINTELKLYDDQDELIVEATSKAKELQANADKAQAAVDELKAKIGAIDNQIANISLTEEDRAVDDLKADKQRELDAAKNNKAALEEELAQKERDLQNAKDALANAELKNKGERSIAHGSNAFASGNDSIAIGTNSEAVKANAVAVGNSAQVKAENGIALGKNAVVNESATGSIAIGADSVVSGEKSIAVGVGHQVTGNRSTTIGDPNTVSGDDAFVAGNNNTVASNKAMVIGNNINVTAGFDGTVVLGDSSAATTANPTASITIRDKQYNFAGATPTSTVSVGAANAERQITNVAAGRVTAASTDAINGSQLYAVVDAVENLKASSDKEESVVAGSNIVVSQTTTNATGGKEYRVSLADSVTLGNVTLGPTGLNNGGNKITNVADGTAPSDAVNLDQLNKSKVVVAAGTNIENVAVSTNEQGQTVYTVNAKGNSVTGSDAITVTPTTTNNSTNYAVDLSQTVKDDIKKGVDAKDIVDNKGLTFTADNGATTVKKLGDSVSIKGSTNITTEATDDGISVKLKDDIAVNSVTLGDVVLNKEGLNNGGNKITNVADGTAPSDAVNLGQLTKSVAAATTEVKGKGLAAVTSEKGVNGQTIYTVNVEKADAPTVTRGNVTVKAGDENKVMTAGDITNAINQSEKTSSVVAGTSGKVTVTAANEDAQGNTEYTVDVKVGSLTSQPDGTATPTNEDGLVIAKDVADTINNTGWNVTANGQDKTLVKNGSTLDFAQGGNILVTKEGDSIKVSTKKEVAFDKVKVGNASIGTDGINAGANTITNVADGVNGKDAVNMDQLDAAKKAATSEVKAGENTVVVGTKGANGQNVYTVHTGKSDVVQGDGITVTNTPTTGANGVINNSFKVELSQQTKDNIQKGIDDAKAADDKAVKAQATADVNKAQIDKGLNVRTQDGTSTNHKLGDTVDIVGSTNITTKTVSGDVVVALKDDIAVKSVAADTASIGPVNITNQGIDAGDTVIKNVADGRVAADSRDAVNGSQLLQTYNYIDAGIRNVHNRMDGMEDALEAGIAGSNASASIPQITMAGKSMVAVATGGYRDKNAIAVGYSRLSDNGRVTFKSHLNADTEKNIGYGVGLGFTW